MPRKDICHRYRDTRDLWLPRWDNKELILLIDR